MKTTVNRQLRGGFYYVSFRVGDFTSEELGKMESFGVPTITIRDGGPPSSIPQQLRVPITKIGDRFNAGFKSEEEAKQYADSVLDEMRTAMKRLRELKDEFTSTDEVNL
jgi:hypothetical protein